MALRHASAILGVLDRVRGRWVRVFWGLLCTLCLSACTTDLYTKQTEQDANLMVAALLENGVPAEKSSPDAGKTWSVRINKSDTLRAMSVLQGYGLPSPRHATLGEMFKKEGLISTPAEERVRFIFGVTQQLESTLLQIDGVVTARVHVVLPNNDPLASAVKPASASVFVKHRPQANVAGLVPSIKTMVARSVEGLSYENVTVTLLPGVLIAPRMVPADNAWAYWTVALVLLVLAVGGGWLAWRRPAWLPARWQRPPRPAAGDVPVEPNSAPKEVAQVSP